MKAIVDKDLCIECGLCHDLCPEVFQIGDDGKAIAKADEIPDEVKASCRDAAQQCPTEAIKIEGE